MKLSKNQSYDLSWIELARAFWWIIQPRRRTYLTFSFLLFIGHFAQLLPALVTGKVVDELLRNYEITPSLIYLVLSFVIVHAVVAILRLEVLKRIGNVRSDIMYHLRVKGFEQLLEQLFIKDTKDLVGSKVQQLNNGIEQVKQLIKILNSVLILGLAILSGAVITFIFSVQWYFTALLTLYTFTAYIITDRFTKRQLELADAFYKSSESTSGVFVEGISNALTVKAQGAQTQFQNRVSQHAEDNRSFEYAKRKVGIFKWQVFLTVNSVTYGAFLLLAVYATLRGDMSVGTVAIIGGYMMRILAVSGDFMESYDDIIEARQGIARMMQIFRQERTPWPGNEKFPRKWDILQFNDVTFSYPKSKSSIYNISFSVPKGGRVGLKGPTGSGKSTIAKLIIGLYVPHYGEISIGRHNIQKISHEELLNHVAIVMQESELFAMSVRDNISMLREIENSFLNKIIHVAQLEQLIKKLPNGLDTMVGEKGYKLSGGERQRIAIARALCKKPDILVFDEATSALDLKTEELLVQAVHETYPDITMLIIAHRPQALLYCENVYEIREGKMVKGMGGFVRT